jgi:hypothetical protein
VTHIKIGHQALRAYSLGINTMCITHPSTPDYKDRDSLMEVGYWLHLHTANCLRRFHCIQLPCKIQIISELLITFISLNWAAQIQIIAYFILLLWKKFTLKSKDLCINRAELFCWIHVFANYYFCGNVNYFSKMYSSFLWHLRNVDTYTVAQF